MAKKEEEKSYTIHFLVLTFLLLIFSFLALKWEFVELRPWKTYQKQFYQLERARLEKEIQKAKADFYQPEVQRQYNQVKGLLEEAKKKFHQPEVQREYHKLDNELKRVKEDLSDLQRESQVVRAELQEHEYLYKKYGRSRDKEKMAELEQRSQNIANSKEPLSLQRQILEKKLKAFTADIEKYTEQLGQFPTADKIIELEMQLEQAKHPDIKIRQVYIEDLNKADRCMSCHLGIDRSVNVAEKQPFTRHPGDFIYLGNHPIEKFGCTVCHWGQGRATSSVDKAHGHVEYWTRPMLKGQYAQAKCQKCHEDFKSLRGVSLLSKGEEVFEKYACWGCHITAGYENRPKTGPPLTFIGQKVNYSWLIKFLQNPKSIYPDARMPKFGFSEEEAKAVADYLFSLSREDRLDILVAEEVDEDLLEKGMALYRQARCSICHQVEGRGGDFKKVYGPDLSLVGSKVRLEWLLEWLEDPKHYYPQTKMPQYRFTKEEITALSEYLLGEFVDWDLEDVKLSRPDPIQVPSIEKGAALIKHYGCFGCHDIKGMEDLKKIGPYLRRSELEEMVGAELSSIGSKPMERIDFGMVKDIEKSRENYLMTKLRTPHVFRDDLKMPDFQLNEEEIEALTVLLLGFTPEEMEAMPLRFRVPAMPNDYEPTGPFVEINDDIKCLTCHPIGGKGGDYAPDLMFEGSKVKKEWLTTFLKTPDIIRFMTNQMPKFNLSDQEATITTDYIKMVLTNNHFPDDYLIEQKIESFDIEAGRKIYYQKQCFLCHQIGSEGGAVGPQLTYVGTRLTTSYIYRHLQNPHYIQPDIVEPKYGLKEDEVLGLTKFLSSLKTSE